MSSNSGCKPCSSTARAHRSTRCAAAHQPLALPTCALALIRDTFGSKHPQFTAISALLDTLTSGLDREQRTEYARRQVSRAPLQPAIDYMPHVGTIARLELAIS